MRLKVTSSKVVLEPGQVLTIDDARGVHIRPVGAKVWVTEEGDCSDFVVNPGEEFVVSRKGRTVVQAIDTTWVDLQEADLKATTANPKHNPNPLFIPMDK